MIKPDGVQRRLVGSIIERFEKKGLTLRAMKLLTPSEGKLKEHYHILRNLPFFPKLIRFMSSGPVVAMVWEFIGAAFPYNIIITIECILIGMGGEKCS